MAKSNNIASPKSKNLNAKNAKAANFTKKNFFASFAKFALSLLLQFYDPSTNF